MSLAADIAGLVGREPVRTRALSGGCVGEVYRVDFAEGEPLVAKVDRSASGQLDVEGAMLQYLAPHLPVPAVVHAAPELLLMEWLAGDSSFSSATQEHAAELLAALHSVRGAAFGFERGTLIGGLPQPNPQTGQWLPFFAEHRLVEMARQAREHGRLDAAMARRCEKLAGAVDRFLSEPEYPALLHGDVWSGNVLAAGDRITGFLDPAVYFGHPEVELAFITMFSTFGEPFFRAYGARRPIAPGFVEERRHLYNLYPYLVHVRLFGGSYVGAVDRILARFGF